MMTAPKQVAVDSVAVCPDGSRARYVCPPHEAVICAFEQQEKKNYNTFAYVYQRDGKPLAERITHQGSEWWHYQGYYAREDVRTC